MATFRVSLNVSEEIDAEDEDAALDIFWEDFLRMNYMAGNANVERLD
ncbi:MAG TPA: hypothetical protein VE422_30770 [Terriglobia bacterium]|nr:hypothetical protein [Terriglobia bacterium]